MRKTLLLTLSICGLWLANAGRCNQSSVCPGKCQEYVYRWFWSWIGIRECDKPCVPGTCCPGWQGSNCDVRAEDGQCLELDGKCQDDSIDCSGEYETGLCGGGKSRRCCPPRISPSDDSRCKELGGFCQNDSTSCLGRYKDNFCAGPKSRRCCFPQLSPYGDDSKCLDRGGKCEETADDCLENYEFGLCRGIFARPCCLQQISIDNGSADCAKVKVITRSQWGARPPSTTTTIAIPVTYFIIRDTAESPCQSVEHCKKLVRDIQDDHMDGNGWDDIGYNFLIGEDGNAYEGRGWDNVGAHTLGYNSISFGAAFMGNYRTSLPGLKAISAAKHLIACGLQQRKLVADYRLYGYRDVRGGPYPGNALYKEIQKWPHYKGDNSAGDDSKCRAIGGECKEKRPKFWCSEKKIHCGQASENCYTPLPSIVDNSQCHKGEKWCEDSISKYCNGCKLCFDGASRRCCVPPSDAGTSDAADPATCNDDTAKKYACDILDLAKNSKIRLWDTHSSGKTDNAYAYNNIVDACKGVPSSRSKYHCCECKCPGAPGGTVCIHRKVLHFIYKLYKSLDESGIKFQVNEIAGACHSCNSWHYKGRAVDLHNKPVYGTSGAVIQPMLDMCKNMSGSPLKEKKHVHCAFKN